ncbi:MAG TPA: pyridoxal-phosphate dependent enzyme [Acidimicrobiales bacterium]|nr:pyridoxal-phosphate dependent enzyme [Acidimicrobiales bacterium]
MSPVANVLELIGNTPTVDISGLSPNPRVSLVVKLEGQNPGGSIKDRVALSMVTALEKDGVLTPGATLMEPTSGNTGISLALIARVRGYRLIAVMADNTSAERRDLLEALGAEIISTPGDEGSNGAVRRAEQLAVEHPEWVFPYQYSNPANPDAHYTGTGPEIWRDTPELTHLVAGLGTGGTLVGAGRYLKEQSRAVQLWAVEPPAGESVAGLRNMDDGYVPAVFTDGGGPALLDRRLIIGPDASVEWSRKLVDQGILAGLSTGAALAGAARCAAEIDEGLIVVVSADGMWKYLSSGAWGADPASAADRLSKSVYF